LYIYDIGDMALPRESEWTDLQKVVAGMTGGGNINGVLGDELGKVAAGR
jgi:dynein intermediate chain